jgi:hypothetical protein
VVAEYSGVTWRERCVVLCYGGEGDVLGARGKEAWTLLSGGRGRWSVGWNRGAPGVARRGLTAQCLAALVRAEGMASRYNHRERLSRYCCTAGSPRCHLASSSWQGDGHDGFCQQDGSWLAHAGHPGCGIIENDHFPTTAAPAGGRCDPGYWEPALACSIGT